MNNDARTILKRIAETVHTVPASSRPWHERILLGCWSVSSCLTPPHPQKKYTATFPDITSSSPATFPCAKNTSPAIRSRLSPSTSLRRATSSRPFPASPSTSSTSL